MTNSAIHGRQTTRKTLNVIFSAIVALAAFVSVVAVDAQSRTRTYVQTLASERLEGRLAGSPGERLAGDFLAGELRKIGARPLPG